LQETDFCNYLTGSVKKTSEERFCLILQNGRLRIDIKSMIMEPVRASIMYFIYKYIKTSLIADVFRRMKILWEAFYFYYL